MYQVTNPALESSQILPFFSVKLLGTAKKKTEDSDLKHKAGVDTRKR